MELWDDIQLDLRQLSREVADMRACGKRHAEADVAYRKAKAKAILAERAKGTPATIAREVIYADEGVCRALMERDCAESLYETARESINALKLGIRVSEAQLQREWTQSGQRGSYS